VCLCLAQAGVLCHSFMSTVMNFFVHKNQICDPDSGDSEGSHLLKCDAMLSGKCLLRGRQQVSQKRLIHIYFGLHGITSKKMMVFIMKGVDFFYDRPATPETWVSYWWVASELKVYSMLVVACSAQAEGAGDVCHVPVPCQEQGVGLAAHICICIPQPLHR